MSDLSTNYLGMKLKNPLIVGSSSLCSTVDGVKKLEAAGAGAVVLKSLFEEQIRIDNEETIAAMEMSLHTEASEYLRSEVTMQYGQQQHLSLIEESKKAVKIPVIASVNCISGKYWTSYTEQIEASGADAIELNISYNPADFDKSSDQIEKEYLGIVSDVTSRVKIPVAVKMSPYFTSIGRMSRLFIGAGSKGLVLFNRFYFPDINIMKMQPVTTFELSSHHEIFNSLRWTALLYKQINGYLCSSTGVHSGEDFVKQILAGSDAVQVCSALYKNGISYISSILDYVSNWMKQQKLNSISEFIGKASQNQNEGPINFERVQYIRKLTGGID